MKGSIMRREKNHVRKNKQWVCEQERKRNEIKQDQRK